MKTSTRALLSSAFIFPGLGQYIYRHYLSAAAFATVSLLAISMVTIKIVNVTAIVLEKVRSGVISPNIGTLHQSITEQLNNGQIQSTEIAIWTFIAAWLLSTLDTYRLSKKFSDNVSEKSATK